MDGWIKSHRIMMNNPIVCKDADHYAVWGYILHYASHAKCDTLFNGKRIKLNPGQLVTGRKKIAEKFRISESKVQRVLMLLESEHQIERQTGAKSSLISVLNWEQYQSDERQTEQQLNINRTTTEQQLNTIQECKNIYSISMHPDALFEIDKIEENLLNDDLWIDRVGMALKLKDPQNTKQWVAQFFAELRAKGDGHKSLKDSKEHFVNWMKIQKTKNNAGTTKHIRKSDLPGRLSGSDFD